MNALDPEEVEGGAMAGPDPWAQQQAAACDAWVRREAAVEARPCDGE